jgi:hypothetical protein
MGTELVSPFGAGSVVVPDDLVDKYRAEGWSVAQAPDEPEPPADKPKARATRTPAARRK